MLGSRLLTSGPVAQIIEHLQRHGQATIKELEELLGVSTTAVREHLVHLQSEGLIASSAVRRGLGRPHNVYALTPKAQHLFPRSYDSLIVALLHELAAEDGAHLDALLGRVSERLAQQYALHITSDELAQRVKELGVLLEQRGIPTDVSPEGTSISLFACPYLEIIREHPSVCAMERRMIEGVLGEKVVLEQSIREGHHSCRFVIDKDR